MAPAFDRKLLATVAILAGLWLTMLLVGGPGSAGDLAVLHAAQFPTLVPAARLLTRLGDWSILLPLTFAATALVAWLRGMRFGAILLVLNLSGRLVVELQKASFDRARPDAHGHLVATHNMAFPSGHAAYSMIFWLGVALLGFTGKARRVAVPIALLLAFSIGLTRLVLAVHWPTDVIGGWSFGAAWTLLLARLAAGRERAPLSVIGTEKESDMTDRDRPDDHELIDSMEDAPSHGGSSGGNLQRDIATQDEEESEIGDGSTTRVRGGDKVDDGNAPTLPNRD